MDLILINNEISSTVSLFRLDRFCKSLPGIKIANRTNF